MVDTTRESAITVDEVLDKLSGVKRCGEGWSARCPAHDDQHPSLTVTEAANGLVLMYCHAECSYEDICRALNISNIVATYDYRNETGELLYQVTRTTPKGFFMRRPDAMEDSKTAWVTCSECCTDCQSCRRQIESSLFSFQKERKMLRRCVSLD